MNRSHRESSRHGWWVVLTGLACGWIAVAAIARSGGAGKYTSAILVAAPGAQKSDIPALGVANTEWFEALIKKCHEGGSLSSEEDEALHAMIRAWLSRDAVACLNYLSSRNLVALASLLDIEDALNHSPEAMANLARAVGDRQIADALFLRSFQVWNRLDPQDAMFALQTFPTYLRRGLEANGITAVVARDGAAGLEQLMGRVTLTKAGFEDGIFMLERADPLATLWVCIYAAEHSKSGEERTTYLRYFYLMIGFDRDRHADECLKALSAMEPGADRDSAIASILGGKVARDPSLLDEMANALDPRSLPKMYSAAAAESAATDPAAAAKIIAMIPGYQDRVEAYWRSGQVLFYVKSPAAAMEWTAKVENPVERTAALSGVAHQWYSRSPVDLTSYLLSRSDDPIYLGVIDSLVQKLDGYSGKLSHPELEELKNLPPAQRQQLADSILPQLSNASQVALRKVLQ